MNQEQLSNEISGHEKELRSSSKDAFAVLSNCNGQIAGALAILLFLVLAFGCLFGLINMCSNSPVPGSEKVKARGKYISVVLREPIIARGDKLLLRVEVPKAKGFVDIKKVEVIPRIVEWRPQVLCDQSNARWGNKITTLGPGTERRGDSASVQAEIPDNPKLEDKEIIIDIKVELYRIGSHSPGTFYVYIDTDSVSLPVKILEPKRKEALRLARKASFSYWQRFLEGFRSVWDSSWENL